MSIHECDQFITPPDPTAEDRHEEAKAVREGASGAGGVAGSGCGCN